MFKFSLAIITSAVFFLNITAFASEDFVSKAHCDVKIKTRGGREIKKRESFSISRDGSDSSKDVILRLENKKLGNLSFWIEADNLIISSYNFKNEMSSLNMVRGKSLTTIIFIEEFAVVASCIMEN